ncbi:CDP-glycerol glycerophosphotransferase family protein [Morganella psychrotolerans]|uniref:CDP-glycerol glycerophosphotransferase family protein n=1 Tax=Morganella psychrotolerans TaxID=368603 RepID=UPI0039B00099
MKKILLLLFLPLFLLIKLIPRNKNIVLFGSNKKTNFSDNPKYLFIEINKYKNDKNQFIYVSKNKQAIAEAKKYGDAIYIYSFRSIILHLRAYYFINSHSIDDFISILTNGAVIVQLWHGLPLKKIGNDTDFNHLESNLLKNVKINLYWKLFPYLDYKRHTYLCISNSIFTPYFMSAFNTIKNRIIYVEQPRVLYSKIDDTIKKQKIKNKIISIFPTYRANIMPSFFSYITDDALIHLNILANEKNYLIYIKPHPLEVSILLDRINSLSLNKVILYTEIDPYPLGKISDLIITDYSSIYFDLLDDNKRIAFICPDINTYLKNIGLYFDYYNDKLTPGHKFSSFDDFLENIQYCFDTIYDFSYIKKHQSTQSILDLIINKKLKR